MLLGSACCPLPAVAALCVVPLAAVSLRSPLFERSRCAHTGQDRREGGKTEKKQAKHDWTGTPVVGRARPAGVWVSQPLRCTVNWIRNFNMAVPSP
jgi:hypothetical protein